MTQAFPDTVYEARAQKTLFCKVCALSHHICNASEQLLEASKNCFNGEMVKYQNLAKFRFMYINIF